VLDYSVFNSLNPANKKLDSLQQ